MGQIGLAVLRVPARTFQCTFKGIATAQLIRRLAISSFSDMMN